jgi:hypothetical protein
MRYLITLPVALFTCACASQVPIGAGDGTSPLKQSQDGNDGGSPPAVLDSGSDTSPPPEAGPPSTGNDDAGPTTNKDAGIGPTTPDAGSPAERVVIFGGSTDIEQNAFDDTWVFDGTRWTQADVVGPSGRSAPWMASLNGKVALFGGTESQDPEGGFPLLSDTWTFDGSTWTRVTGPGPSARTGAGSASLGGKAILFGGSDASGTNFNDTWTFDGTTWTLVPTSTAPSARNDPAMATLGDKVILFGGGNATGRDGDLWSFDGTTWTELSITGGPAARVDAAMASLGTTKVALFGGITDEAYLNDTWVFDGAAWTQINATNGPQLGPSVTAFNGVVLLLDDSGGEWTFDGAAYTPLTFTAYPVTPSVRGGEGIATIP